MTPYHHLSRTGAPPTECITLAEAKLYLRVDTNEDDLLINDMIASIRQFAELYIGRSLVLQSWEASYLEYVPSELYLPMPPVNSITSVTLRDNHGNDTIISDTAYHLKSQRIICFDTVPSSPIIHITFTAGDASLDHPLMKQALLSHISYAYEHRSLEAPAPSLVREFYDSCKEVRI